jgi:hypothetical protein
MPRTFCCQGVKASTTIKIKNIVIKERASRPASGAVFAHNAALGFGVEKEDVRCVSINIFRDLLW